MAAFERSSVTHHAQNATFIAALASCIACNSILGLDKGQPRSDATGGSVGLDAGGMAGAGDGVAGAGGATATHPTGSGGVGPGVSAGAANDSAFGDDSSADSGGVPLSSAAGSGGTGAKVGGTGGIGAAGAAPGPDGGGTGGSAGGALSCGLELACNITPWKYWDTRWIWGDIYYDFEGAWTTSERNQILSAMTDWQQATEGLIRFNESSTAENRIVLPSGAARCSADWGMLGGVQTVHAWSGYCSKLDQLRVLGHVIGLPLQHMRPDRDRYVELDPARLCDTVSASGRTPDQASLDVCISGNAAGYGPYDLNSVMEYSEAFPEGCELEEPASCAIHAKDRSRVPVPSGVTLGDASAVLEMYWTVDFLGAFTPVASADPGPTEPLDLDLTPGVAMVGAPGLSYQAEQVMDAFALGDDGHIYHKPYAYGWREGYWTDLGGSFAPAGDKVVASASSGLGEIDLVARIADGGMRHRRCTGGSELAPCSWEATWSEPLAPPGGGATSGPALVAAPDGRLDLFVRSGSDLYQCSRIDGTWGAWVRHDGPIAQTPAAASYEGITHLLAATANGGLVAKSGDVAALPSGWTLVDGSPLLAPGTSPAIAYEGYAIEVRYQALSGMLAFKAFMAPDPPDAPVDWPSGGVVMGGILEGSPAIVRWRVPNPKGPVAHVVANIQGTGMWHRAWAVL